MGLSPAQIQKAADLKQSMLRAAAQIAAQQGVQALTLEAVAKQAGASKGALLHHFSSKADLLEAMMTNLIERFEDDLDRYAEADPDPRGRRTRAVINACAHSASYENRLGVAIVAAMHFDPALLKRWQELAARWLEEDLAEADPVQASILRLVTNGLWASETFGLYPMDAKQRAAVVERLLAMTRV
ncbi:MAG: TetR/AcrR family transcriptional regulator [Microvirga sp.]